MAVTVLSINGTECIGDSLPKINNNFSELAKFVAPDFLSTEIANSSHSVNTTNKQVGKIIFDKTNNRLMVATGNTPTSTWVVLSGSTITPS